MTTATYNFTDYTQQFLNPTLPCGYNSTAQCPHRVNEWKGVVQNVARAISSWVPSIIVLPKDLTAADAVKIELEDISTRTDAGFMDLQREVINYLYLPHDWDGHGGQHAHPQAVLDALEFLKCCLSRNLPVPKPMLSGSGIVGLYWDRGSHYASMEFEGDGTYTYLTDSPEGYNSEEGIAAVSISSNLLQYLLSLPHIG